jgi:hypothetical protein
MALRASVVREIGERLDLSRHTVKTQAMSIYRKLGVSSRSQAIQRLQEISLVGHRATPTGYLPIHAIGMMSPSPRWRRMAQAE